MEPLSLKAPQIGSWLYIEVFLFRNQYQQQGWWDLIQKHCIQLNIKMNK